jgi:cell division protein FtsB
MSVELRIFLTPRLHTGTAVLYPYVPQNSKLKTQNSKLKTQNSKLKTQNSKLLTPIPQFPDAQPKRELGE